MIQKLLLGLTVSFAYILGPLLGKWTKDEGKKLRKSAFAKALGKFGALLAVIYGLILGLAWRLEYEASVALVIFGLILAQTSLNGKRNHAFIFLLLFLVVIFLK